MIMNYSDSVLTFIVGKKIFSKGAKFVLVNLYLYQLTSISKYNLGLFAKISQND